MDKKRYSAKDLIAALQAAKVQHMADGGTIGMGAGSSLAGPSAGGAVPNAINPASQGIGGAIGGFLGVNNNFQAGAANIQAGTNADQLNTAYNQAQQGLGQQQGLVNDLRAQGGLQNQSNFLNQQQALANQLQQQALGQGPNPAQAALNAATGKNVSNQAALMAGQRGSAGNAGMMARQIAQSQGDIQQQAAGQSATMQAQQQIAAQQALANQQAQMQGVAANQVAALGQNTNVLSQAAQNEQNILQGANTAYNNAAVTMQGNLNNVNAQTASQNAQTSGGLLGGIIGGIGSFLGLAEGGEVPEEPEQAPPPASTQPPAQPEEQTAAPAMSEGEVKAPEAIPVASGPQSFAGQFLSSTPVSAGPSAIAAPAPNSGKSPGELAGQGLGTMLSGGMGGAGGSSGGGGGGMGSMMALMAAKGGQVKKFATGGPTDFAGGWQTVAPVQSAGPQIAAPTPYQAPSKDSSKDATKTGQDVGKKLRGAFDKATASNQSATLKEPELGSQFQTQGPTLGVLPEQSKPGFSLGANTNLSASAPEGWVHESELPISGFSAQSEAKGGVIKALAAAGGHVPGKPKVKGNSLKNDVVPAVLSPGEVVIPNSVMQSKDPAGGAARFVAAVLARKGKGK